VPENENKYYYLACFPARPIRLLPDRKYFMGRGEGNNVVISDPEVSRKHSVLYWENGAFVIEDFDSRNGTYVNRKRIKKERLEDGDKIRIGNRTFTVMVEREHSVRRMILRNRAERQGGETEILDIESMMGPSAGFAGSLSDFGVPEILQVIDLNRKTGKLSIVSDEGRGDIFVKDGQVIHAKIGQLQGEEAVYRMLRAERGYFEFDMRAVDDVQPTVAVKTANLLMEGFRRMDESEKLKELQDVPSKDAPSEAGKSTEEAEAEKQNERLTMNQLDDILPDDTSPGTSTKSGSTESHT
jgi:pSer/pThr/pTyr-binding forkhead associated (FHA) protein